MSNGIERTRLSAHNIVASYTDRDKAEAARKELLDAGLSEEEVTVGTESDRAQSLKAEMREEVEHSAAGPGLPVVQKEQAKGATKWALLGAAAGAAIGLIAGVVMSGIGSMDGAGPVVIGVIAFALGGSVAGAMFGGMAGPIEREVERDMETASRVTLGVHTPSEENAAQALQILEASGADRLDRLDSGGNPFKDDSEGERGWH